MTDLAALSGTDFEIVETLALRVRLLTVPQIARTWWAASAHSRACARRAALGLQRRGLVRTITLVAHPELVLENPVISWNLGQGAPDFAAGARVVRTRWTASPEMVRVIIATAEAAHFFGGIARSDPRRSEQTHELHMSTVFLVLAARSPELVPFWKPEGWLRRSRPSGPGVKLPDAMLRSPTGIRVIEFGGAYSRQKLEAFHAFCADASLPYEVW